MVSLQATDNQQVSQVVRGAKAFSSAISERDEFHGVVLTRRIIKQQVSSFRWDI